ncbi:GNAT family N-acetyltransferase [Segetibacter aerophilus]|uniref:Alanine acetyltransferase n=1 Tax=Segetibacter aerophilus TaxID=670293 RepID=A0A512BAE3_9BACT|nr:GNAT family N-acetyltransferase [Segetibacter aerophilus]GEO08930.1 alanine acetyltransferase [Segetibacter aerophilus]
MEPTIFTTFPTLTTDRLILRALSIADEKEIFALRSNEQVNKYLDREPCKSLEDARGFIQKITEAVVKNDAKYWAITMKNSDKLIGTICYFNEQPTDRKAEIGFELMPAFHSKGIMQEALAKVIQFGFQTLQLTAIEAFTHKLNEPSIRLLKKFNFKEQVAPMSPSEEELIFLKLSALDAQDLLSNVS